MEDQMHKAKLIAQLKSGREEWEALLARVDDARMTTPGVAGEWSVKDTVSHVTAYERWLVSWLQAVSRGELPEHSILENADIDQRNAAIFEQNRDRPLNEVLSEAQGTFEQLLAAVEVLSDEDLTDAARSDWFVKPYWKVSRPLWECIAGDSYEHYREHAADIQAWLAGQ